MSSASPQTDYIQLSRLSPVGDARSSVAVFAALFLVLFCLKPDSLDAQYGFAGALVILSAIAYAIERASRPFVLQVIGRKQYNLLKAEYGLRVANFVAVHYARGGALDEYEFIEVVKKLAAPDNGGTA